MTDIIIDDGRERISLYIRDGKNRVIAVHTRGSTVVRDFEPPEGYLRALKVVEELRDHRAGHVEGQIGYMVEVEGQIGYIVEAEAEQHGREGESES